MKKHCHIYPILTVALYVTVMSLCSCVKEVLEETPRLEEQECEYIRFRVEHQTMTKSTDASVSQYGHLIAEEEEWQVEMTDSETDTTKATPVVELDMNKASVSAFLGSGGNPSWTFFNKNFVFDFESLDPESDGDKIGWSTVGNAESMAIYSFSPRPSDESALKLDTGTKTITYSADVEDPTKHLDIFAASTVVPAADFGKTIPLEFHHALTGVRFKMGFECYVQKIIIKNISSTMSINLAALGTPSISDKKDYTFEINKKLKIGEFINYGETTYMMVPQTLDGASVQLVYSEEEEGSPVTITTELDGKVWQSGKLITYTLKETFTPTERVYFDLAAGNVEISAEKYKGYVFNNGERELKEDAHDPKYMYHVYQSATTKRAASGITGRPVYPRVTYDGKSWGEYITNNTVVENVIYAWDDEIGARASIPVSGSAPGEPASGATGAVRTAGREGTGNWIKVSGSSEYHLTIDNLYSTHQQHSTGRTEAGLAYLPDSGTSSLVVYLEGDNRFGCVHYAGHNKGNKLTFENNLNGSNGAYPGTLTAADVDYVTVDGSAGDHGGAGYYGNHWCAAIGHNDGAATVYGLAINSGIIYAGTTAAENCTAIGAGGNGYGQVTINGGTVTAVATTTGTAIGGGIGFHSYGGKGDVTIAGGDVYAYNHKNKWNIPSSAIGGAGSKELYGAKGTVLITNGNVYAQSVLGTAIGGGSSYWSYGGEADVTITGGKVTAKSLPSSEGADDYGAGIGGGSGCSSTDKTHATKWDGGNAKIKISGDPIIRTGSIGGGKTRAEGAYLGKADIQISGGDIQAQFIMEATGAGEANRPKFVMSGGTIRDSNPFNTDGYHYVMDKGGAVYMNEGTFEMSGGTIRDCRAVQGGAVYIAGTVDGEGNYTSEFTMTGGTIKSCAAAVGTDPSVVPNGGGVFLRNGYVNISATAEIRECEAKNGGAIYLEGGRVQISGGNIYDNIVTGGNGGGISIVGGDFIMSEGGGYKTSFYHNTAIADGGTGGSGGGIYITSTSSSTSDVEVDILSGAIQGNSADRLGGGICVDMDDAKSISVSANVTVGVVGAHTDNPGIQDNRALLEGGGMYVIGSKANVTINNGYILGNITSGYVYNENVANEKGLVNLKDRDVTTSVVVTFDGNGGILNETTLATTAVQYIVKSTNSLLIQPEYYNYTGHTLKCWHTRPDGDNTKGKEYHDGDVMNLTQDITLYAIWD